MSTTVEFKITTDSSNIQIISALSLLMGADLGAKVEAAQVEAKTEEAPKAPAKKAAPKAAVKKPEPIEEEEEAEDLDPLGEEEETATLEDLKAMQGKKVTAHRDAIVKKLRGFGAAKLSELEEAHYQEYYDFMAKLK